MSDMFLPVMLFVMAIPGWIGSLFIALCVYLAYQWVFEGLFNDDSSRKR